MGDPESVSEQRSSSRVRVPFALVTLATLLFGAYYLLFVERKTVYYGDRNARLIVGLAAQLRDSLDQTSDYVQQAARLPGDQAQDIFIYKPADQSSPPTALFTKIDKCADLKEDSVATEDRPHRYADRTAGGLVLHFNYILTGCHEEANAAPAAILSPTGLARSTNPGNALANISHARTAGPSKPVGATPNTQSAEKPSLVTSSIDLSRLVDQIVQQSAAGAFTSVFVLDSTGTVVYQRDVGTDEAGSVKIARLHELTERRYFGKDQVVSLADLLATSRKTSVRIGDADYQLFSAPIRSGIVVEGKDEPRIANTLPDDTWVICGIVRESEFRARALAISVTLVSTTAAGLLLLIFSWPFLKVTLISATHRLGTIDVMLLGLCGILASSILSLTVLDWLAYSNLEAAADEQLEALAGRMDANFAKERVEISRQLDAGLDFAENQFETSGRQSPNPAVANAGRKVTEQSATASEWHMIDVAPLHNRNGNLLQCLTLSYPYIQSFTLVGASGWQGIKWFVDTRVTPIVTVATRTYFTAARDKTNDYVDFGPTGGGKLAIQSVRSITTGLPEVDFGKRVDERPKDGPSWQAMAHDLPVITMTVPDALSVGRPIFPRFFGFAIIDTSGKVLFHSENQRNTLENFFDETDRDRRLRAAVIARRDEQVNIRYWGDDYRAFVHPMRDLPWTVITFREKRGLRTLNTEALIITMVFILILVGPGLTLFIALVKLVRPRYSARWLWPDPARVFDYADLALIYSVLLVAAGGLIALLPEGALMFLPYWFVPMTLIVTYVRIAKPNEGPKRYAMLLAMVSFLAIGALSVTIATMHLTSAMRRPACLLLMALIASSMIYAAWRAVRTVIEKPERLDRIDSSRDREDIPGTGESTFKALEVVEAPEGQLKGDDDAASADPGRERRIKQRSYLPLAYCGMAFLLLLLTSAVPTAAFFKAAYRVEMVSFVKSIQVQLARDLQARWWRSSAEYNDARGSNKSEVFAKRWGETLDLYHNAAFSTFVHFNPGSEAPPLSSGDASAFPHFIEEILPHYSEASVSTRELIHDRSSDAKWWWTFRTDSDSTLVTLRQKLPTNAAAYVVSAPSNRAAVDKDPNGAIPTDRKIATETAKEAAAAHVPILPTAMDGAAGINGGAVGIAANGIVSGLAEEPGKSGVDGIDKTPNGSFSIESVIPRSVIGFSNVTRASDESSVATIASLSLRIVVIIILLAANFWIAKFIARRVFLVDLVNPRWLTQGVLGLRHVICYPYDDHQPAAAEKKRHGKQTGLFDKYARIDFFDEAEFKRAEGLPQGFPTQPFEPYVLIKGLDYRFATGERARMLRGLIERLMQNSDRNIVLLPRSMGVITSALLQGGEAEEWSKVLSSFVWVSGAQLSVDAAKPKASGRFPVVAFRPRPANPPRTLWQRLIHMFSGVFGFASYIEQIVDGRLSAERTFREETKHDAYLATLVQGLDSEATARDQVLEEIGERAENYYTSLWHTCTHLEKIVLLQLAQTGLVNEKMRKDVRRLLARGLIRRDPRMRVMNETFRRFVLSQGRNSELAKELEPGFGTDTWQRFRVPLFATVLVVALFFFLTQHEFFDATIASVTGLTAALPAFAKVLTVWGDRATRTAR